MSCSPNNLSLESISKSTSFLQVWPHVQLVALDAIAITSSLGIMWLMFFVRLISFSIAQLKSALILFLLLFFCAIPAAEGITAGEGIISASY